MEDERFKHIATDPKFKRIPKHERKVKIDQRFKSMFNDEQFKVTYSVDKRGRPLNKTSSEDLKRYYDLSDSSDSETQSDDNVVAIPPAKGSISSEVKTKLQDLSIDYARGEGRLFDESSSDEESESEDYNEDLEDIEHQWGELDCDADQTDSITRRLAACNMDWDKIRAMDLMLVFTSFLPTGGTIESVVIYASDYGKKRMAEEEIRGPEELTTTTAIETDGEEGDKFHMEKLRQYQLNRLKYYYAIITCDSAESANKIYTECDGMEYESTATKIDLRFVPDDTSFAEQPIKDKCDRLPEAHHYEPRYFTTTALQQATVKLTWDETDPDRIEFNNKINSGKIENVSQNELQNYVAMHSSSSDSEDEDNPIHSTDQNNENVDSISKYKALLNEINEKEDAKRNDGVKMEVTWGRIDIKEKAEELVKQKLKEEEVTTPYEKYLEKRKEKKKLKAKQRKDQAISSDDEDTDDVPSDVDLVNDPYFAEEFSNSQDWQSKKKRKQKSRKDNNVKENSENANELALLLMDADEREHFNLKDLQKDATKATKKTRKAANNDICNQDNFTLNANDDRFSAIFSNHLYNIDPTHPQFKRTRCMDMLIEEKSKRRKEYYENPDNPMQHELTNNAVGRNQEKHELKLLVKKSKSLLTLRNKIK